MPAPHTGRNRRRTPFDARRPGRYLPSPRDPTRAMKLKIRRSKVKRLKKVGFRTRSKTAGGRKVIKRKIKRSGKFRVG